MSKYLDYITNLLLDSYTIPWENHKREIEIRCNIKTSALILLEVQESSTYSWVRSAFKEDIVEKSQLQLTNGVTANIIIDEDLDIPIISVKFVKNTID